MRTVTLQRNLMGDDGCFGVLTTDSGYSCASGELPWRDNKPDISCIPGNSVYMASYDNSGVHGECYRLNSVLDRTNVEIHAGSYCGDKSLGYKSDVLGCIIVGETVGELWGQKALINSKVTLVEFISEMNKETFMLTVKDIPNGGPKPLSSEQC